MRRSVCQIQRQPNRVCIEGGRSVKAILKAVWSHLALQGRLVVTASSLEGLYAASESFSELQVRNIEVVQSAMNRLEKRGMNQTFASVDPIFVLSGEKLE